MYFLLKMVMFQPAMLVYQRVITKHLVNFPDHPRVPGQISLTNYFQQAMLDYRLPKGMLNVRGATLPEFSMLSHPAMGVGRKPGGKLGALRVDS